LATVVPTFDTVREIGLALPGVEEGLAYGSPALKLNGQVLACIPAHKSAEPDSLMVRVPLEERAELLEADPDLYYLPEHYAGHSSILIRLPRADREILRDLLGMAWKFVSKQTAKRKPAR